VLFYAAFKTGNMKRYLWVLLSCVIAGGLVIWMVGGQLSAAVLTNIGSPPSNVPFEAVSYESVRGWYLPASKQSSCILLMHGVRSNRREMVGRAIFLRKEGFPSLAIDLQAHGETPGKEITFGYKEAESARKAVRFLRQIKGCEKVIALGSSLGGAAALLGIEPLNVDGYILEAVYSRIEKAVQNRLRMRIGAIGDLFAPLLYRQIPVRLGIELVELQPVEAIRNVKAPVLILSGTEDLRTTKKDTLALFNNAPEPKTLVWINGAGHANLFKFDRDIYGEAVLKFLAMVD
jgi:alpha-beta hydrolase superfamily lysophospholipase